MAAPPTFPNFNPTVGNPRPQWFARNWKWAVPVGLVGLPILCVLLLVGFLAMVQAGLRHNGAYREALARVQANPQVIERLGQPIQPGFAGGEVSLNGTSDGDADLSIGIRGPKGKGTVYVLAKKSAGEWTFEKLQVTVAGQAQRIDLLKPEESQAKDH